MRVEGPGKEKVITSVLPHVVFALQSDALIFGPNFKLTCVILIFYANATAEVRKANIPIFHILVRCNEYFSRHMTYIKDLEAFDIFLN